jgi:hypothetical protein
VRLCQNGTEGAIVELLIIEDMHVKDMRHGPAGPATSGPTLSPLKGNENIPSSFLIWLEVHCKIPGLLVEDQEGQISQIH